MRSNVPYRSRWTSYLVLALLASGFSAGCGGGGGSTDDGTMLPTPSATIHFPPSVAVTNQSSITVRGTTTASAGVAAVRVNGLLASTSDAFATWSGTVPLVLGANEIRVDVETTAGIVLPDSAKGGVRRAVALLTSVNSVDRDPGANVAYVHDRFEGLLRFTPATSTWTLVSAEGVYASSYGTTGGAFDPSTDDYYQLYSNELVRIDVQTGARATVSGSGPALGSSAEDVDVDGNGSAYVVGYFSSGPGDAVLRVDLGTGDRFDVSSASMGTGTAFVDPKAVDVTGGGSAIYVYDAGPETLVRVDPGTGNRTVLLDASSAISTFTLDRVGLVVDPPNSLAYVAQKGVVYRLDWAGASVTTAFDRAAGHEDVLGEFRDIAGAPGDRLLAVDVPERTSGGWSGLSSIALSTAALTVHTDTSVGSGPATSLTDLEDLVVDPVRGSLLLLDGDGHVTALDLATGVRSVVSSDTVGSGPPIGSGSDEALVFDGDRTAFVGAGNEIFAVDVETGARQLTSDDAGVGTGPDFDTYGGLSWDPGLGRVVAGAVTDDLLMRVDPVTGNRVLFTSEPLYDLYDLDLDAERSRVYMATEFDPGPSYEILTADLATGVVSPFFDFDADTGDDLDSVEMLASDAATGRLFVLNYPVLIYELDADTAVPAFVADLGDPTTGPPGQNTFGLAAAPRTGVLYAAVESGVQAIDAETGERVLIAK